MFSTEAATRWLNQRRVRHCIERMLRDRPHRRNQLRWLLPMFLATNAELLVLRRTALWECLHCGHFDPPAEFEARHGDCFFYWAMIRISGGSLFLLAADRCAELCCWEQALADGYCWQYDRRKEAHPPVKRVAERAAEDVGD